MSTIKIAANGTITLPAKLRKALGLTAGDLVSAELRNGRIVIKPVKIVDADVFRRAHLRNIGRNP